MFRHNLKVYAFFCATLLAAITTRTTLAQDDQDDEQDFDRKPWPTYSFQNMPKTRFTCSDKILGGYYADPETQCQMFHVCVKLPGVGVRDYRFLCPNGTLFDQDTQICANWNDVYCDQSGQYLGGGDSNDLYRGAGGGAAASFDNKRADEEEGTFHLQRAESGDIRRSKARPSVAASAASAAAAGEQTQNFGKQRFEATSRNSYNTQTSSSKKPIVSFYTPTTTTTTTSSTTERYNDDSKQDFDEIFKGSHSSHFFANRNGGREDDFVDSPVKNKPNDFSELSKTQTEKSRASINRGAGRTASTTTTTAKSTTTATPLNKIAKKITLHASYNTDFLDYAQFYKSTTASTTTTTTTARPTYNSASRFGFSFSDYQTQEKIQPTTYNPNNSAYRLKTTTTPKYELGRSTNNLQDNDYEKNLNKPTATSGRKSQKHKLGPQDSNFINQNEFTELARVRPLHTQSQPQPFQPAQSAQRPTKLNATKPIEPQYYRSRGLQPVRLGSQEPAPFSIASVPASSAAAPRTRLTSEAYGRTRVASPTANNIVSSSARAITNRGSITYKATTQRDNFDSEFYYTATTANTKKPTTFAPPKDVYTPTTFKPTTYKKAYEQNFYQTPRPTLNAKPQKIHSTSTTTTQLPITVNPSYSGNTNPDEDDGQYHPELYEADFPRNRIKHLRARTTTSTTARPPTTPPQAQAVSGGRKSGGNFNGNHNFQHSAQSHLKTQQQTSFQKEKEQSQSVDGSDEDELFNTAQSLNFGAASINKLRADIYKAEKTSQQYNSQYSPNVPLSSPKTVAPTSTTNGFTYSAYSVAFSTAKPFSTTYLTTPSTTPSTTTTTTTTTTRRPTTTTPKTTTSTPPSVDKLHFDDGIKRSKPSKSNKKETKGKSKRPAHADEDTSYDYAYYDTDTLIDDYP